MTPQGQVIVDGGHYRITSKFNPGLNRTLRFLPKSRWDKKSKQWVCPVTDRATTILQGLGWLPKESSSPSPVIRRRLIPPIHPRLLEGFGKTLMPFQVEGVSFLVFKNGRAYLADEMGLGKTIQVLAWFWVTGKFPAFVVCPSTAKWNWEEEIKSCLGDGVDVVVLSGEKPYPLPPAHVYILNYDIAQHWAKELAKAKCKTGVYDESHFIKNRAAKRSKACRLIGKRCSHILAVSGTPITNRPFEFYETLRLIDPALFPNQLEFGLRYCDAHHDGYGWDFAGASNTAELHDRLTATVMLRRLKKDVLPQLPRKVRSVIPLVLTPDQQREYRKAELGFLEWVEDNAGQVDPLVGMGLIEKLKQRVVDYKLPAVINWITEYLEEQDKLVVFTTHIKTIEALQKAFSKICVRLDGSTSPVKRKEAVTRFQADPAIRLFLGNLKAAGSAITLTAASATLHVELGWSPGDHDQAEDRVHRIGQKSDSVFAYYIIMRETVEMKLWGMLNRKRQTISETLDGTPEQQNRGLLLDLIREYKAR